MTNPILSNAVENKGVILWQYDHAYNLIALIDGFNKIATDTVTQFWDYFRDGVFNIMTADEFGLNVLGRLMGLPRPTVLLPGGDSSESESEEGYWGLTFTAEEPNSTITMDKIGDAPAVSLETSVDGGLTWQPFIIGETVITLANVGDSVCFQAGDGGTGGDGLNTTMSYGYDNANRFVMRGGIAASGDISSLLDRHNTVSDLTGRNWCFYRLFGECSSLTAAPALPAVVLAPACYVHMFEDCVRIVYAPILPAAVQAPSCYYRMFRGCESLRYVKVQFTEWIYTIEDGWCTQDWLYDVARSGTFECLPDLDTSTRDESHVPEGWTVVNPSLSSAPVAKTVVKTAPPLAIPDGQSALDQLTPTPISDDFFRRLLLGRFFLFGMSPTVPNYNKYLNIIYGRFSSDILPVAYTIAGETRTIEEIAQLAIVETPASGGDSSDSGDDTPATLAVYDGRNNTVLFTMVEDASSTGKFVYAAPNPAKGFSITFGGEPPTIGSFPATVNKAKVDDGLDMAMSFVPLSPDGQAQPDQLTPEERAMHEQHPDIIYFYPAGIRSNAVAQSATEVIGTEGQSLENLADAFSWVQPVETAKAGGIFAGNESAKYLDGVVEPSAAPDPRTFYVQSIGGIATVALQRIGSAPTVSLEYSLGDDDQWDAYQFGSDPIELSPGQFVRFRAPADGVNVHFASESSKCHQFAFTGKVAIGGNILSLLYKDPTGKKAFPGSSTWQFGYLFRGCTQIEDATKLLLNAETLAAHCYRGMFSGCSAMETAPSLPAQSLSNYCYASMFNGCTALKRVAADFEAFSSASATSSWLNGVADTGVFHCKEGLVIESRSVNTVPAGWEIKRDRG